MRRAPETPPRRSRKSAGKARPASSPIKRIAVRQVIAGERLRLMEASALLQCLYQVLLYVEGEAAAYADVAKMAQRVLDEVADRLDLPRAAGAS